MVMGITFQLAPAVLAICSEIDEGGLQGVEYHPVLAVDAKAKRLVALEHGNGVGVAL